MRKLFILICVLSCCMPLFAQKPTIYVAVVNSNNEQVDENSHRIIVDVFQKYLHKKYNVRLTRGNDIYTFQKKIEQRFQESGAVAVEDVMDGSSESAAEYYCVIEISQSKGYKNITDYYINAKIYNLDSGIATKLASYPNENVTNENILKEIESRQALQVVSLHLLEQFGYIEDSSIIKNAESNHSNYFKTINNQETSDKKEINRNAALCSIIPGVGLMMKGHHWTGAAYLVGDAALLGGGAGMLVYANKQKDIFNSYNTSSTTKEIARRNYNTANTVSYCCFGAAAVLYIGNIIHSYLATPDDDASPKFQYAIAPSYNKVICGSPDMGFEFALRYNF